MKAVFADTFYWIALTNPRDGFHVRLDVAAPSEMLTGLMPK